MLQFRMLDPVRNSPSRLYKAKLPERSRDSPHRSTKSPLRMSRVSEEVANSPRSIKKIASKGGHRRNASGPTGEFDRNSANLVTEDSNEDLLVSGKASPEERRRPMRIDVEESRIGDRSSLQIEKIECTGEER